MTASRRMTLRTCRIRRHPDDGAPEREQDAHELQIGGATTPVIASALPEDGVDPRATVFSRKRTTRTSDGKP
ncbi:hypothetical protein [Haladaptatus halobius]|uniref:hypothetical protein n=1 Tax=Haladaptatus halobius TaxID=2884875 RepID=UPI001D0BAAE5|nr:hypothetical protein [Haladaptatus halobius]